MLAVALKTKKHLRPHRNVGELMKEFIDSAFVANLGAASGAEG